jgi:hypothetical protein
MLRSRCRLRIKVRLLKIAASRTEAITVYGRADHCGVARAGGRRADRGGLSQTRRQLGDVLQMEGGVRRTGRIGGQAAEGALAGFGSARRRPAERLSGLVSARDCAHFTASTAVLS